MNSLSIPRPSTSALRCLAVASGMVLTTVIFFTPGAQAQDASKILKTMTDYVTSQKEYCCDFRYGH